MGFSFSFSKCLEISSCEAGNGTLVKTSSGGRSQGAGGSQVWTIHTFTWIWWLWKKLTIYNQAHCLCFIPWFNVPSHQNEWCSSPDMQLKPFNYFSVYSYSHANGYCGPHQLILQKWKRVKDVGFLSRIWLLASEWSPSCYGKVDLVFYKDFPCPSAPEWSCSARVPSLHPLQHPHFLFGSYTSLS